MAPNSAMFDRWKSPWPRSWPFAVFKKHHTELNDHYWGLTNAISLARIAAKDQSSATPLQALFAKLGLPAPRSDFSVKRWIKATEEGGNWVRLSCLVAMSGYLETYLRSITRLALVSDPGLIISAPRALDGLSLAKHGRALNVDRRVDSMAEGTWHERIKSYQGCFGKVPQGLADRVSILDTIRRMRNEVGHTFGRSGEDYRNPLLLLPQSPRQLTEARLQKFLGAIEKTAVAVDAHLLNEHLGAAEILLMYHSWKKKTQTGSRTEAKAFRAEIPHAQGSPPPADYFTAAIDYYLQV